MCEASRASVRFFSLHSFFLCSPFGFLSHYTPGLGWRDHPGWTGIARTALPSEPWAGPEQQGRSPRDVTGLLSHHGLGVTDNLPPGTGICRCLAAPGGLFPTQDLPAQGGLCPGGWGAQGFVSPWLVFHLLRSGEMGRQEPGSGLGHPPPHLGPPRLVLLLPAVAVSPTGPPAPRDPLPQPHISRQVLFNKPPIAMQGGSRVPPRFEWPRKPGPLCPSWNHCLSPVPAGTLCRLALCQRGSGIGHFLTKDGVWAPQARGGDMEGVPFATWGG